METATAFYGRRSNLHASSISSIYRRVRFLETSLYQGPFYAGRCLRKQKGMAWKRCIATWVVGP